MSADFFSRPIVCNTGPLIALARAGLARLLPEIFPAVLIPEAVAAELLAKDTADREQVTAALAFVKITPLAAPMEPLLASELDSGEAAVIQLAREQSLSSVLIDEKKARRIAAIIYQLEVRGTAAVLLEAKKRALIPSVGDALAAMAAGGYFIGPQLRAECLKRAGE